MFVYKFMTLRRFTVGLIFLLTMTLSWAYSMGNVQPLLAAQPVANGYRDFIFPTVGVGSNDNELTGEKPESKLWWNDGYWWASMLKNGSASYHIFRLNMFTQDWEDTGVALDDRPMSRADVLWDAATNKLYVVSHIFTLLGAPAPAGQRGELFRYSYDLINHTYTLDSGFPVEVNQGASEALVLAKDSTGTLWVTYVQSASVMVNHTLNQNDATWGTPFILPAAGAGAVGTDDMASIIAYNGRIGVMWSSRAGSAKMYFASHVDGTGDTAADWTSLAVYTPSGDDHMNLKAFQSDSEGHLYAVVKTSFTLNANPEQPWIVLLACKTLPCAAANNWTPYTVWTTSDKSPTRAQLLIDTENRDLYIFSRIIYDLNNNKKGIYYKSSDLDNISFVSGDGTAFITSATETDINNPTTTKQNVNRATGLVVLASDVGTNYYLHNCLTLVSAGGICGPSAAAAVGFSSSTYTVNETNASALITVTLNQVANKALTVNYAASGGTATSGSDYTAQSGTLSFAVGDLRKTFSVPILNDSLDEASETISLTLSSPVNIDLGMPSVARLSINDDDSTPTLQVSPAALTVPENVSGGSTPITFTLSGPSSSVIQVQYRSDSGTATAQLDFTTVSNTLTFAPGQTSQVLMLPIVNDTWDEEDETVNLLFSNPSNVGLPNASATVSIRDDDAPPTVQFAGPAQQVAESAHAATISVTLSSPSGRSVKVNYNSTPGTAAVGSDYTAASGVLTFNPGEGSKIITLPVLNDTVDETNETVNVTLSAPTNATLGGNKTTQVTIVDDDTAPIAAFTTATFAVNEGETKGVIKIQLTSSATSPLSVGYTIHDGTAALGQDYQGNPTGTVTFNSGESNKSIEIPINNDSIDEEDETVTVALSNPTSGLQLSEAANATLVIKDNDNPPLVQWSTTAFSVNENDDSGQALLMVHLSVASGRPVSITYSVSDETATVERDYQVPASTLSFKPGETNKSVAVELLNDTLPEGNETLKVQLTGATNANLGAIQSAELIINDEDGLPSVYLAATTLTVLENSVGGTAVVTVTLNTPASEPITVDYLTSDGSATAGSDYVAASGQLNFAPGELAKSFAIALMDDDQPEVSESINVRLVNSTNATVGAPASATLMILDNDQDLTNHVYLAAVFGK